MDEKKKFNSGLSIMVWGMISHEGPEAIYWINEDGKKFNAEGYIDVLSDDFILE